MTTKEWVKTSWASLTIAALMLQPLPTLAESQKSNGVADQKTVVEIAPRSSALVARYTRSLESEPPLDFFTYFDRLWLGTFNRNDS